MRKNIRAIQDGIDSVSNLRAKLWHLLPGEIENCCSPFVLVLYYGATSNTKKISGNGKPEKNSLYFRKRKP